MEFKKYEIEKEGNFITRLLKSGHFRKSVIFVLIGALLGFLYFYYTEGQHMEKFALESLLKHTILGAFLGFFITNSPCARGRC